MVDFSHITIDRHIMIHLIKFNHMVSFFFAVNLIRSPSKQKILWRFLFRNRSFFLTPPHSKFVGNKYTTTNTCNSFASSNILHSSTDGGVFIIWIFFFLFFKKKVNIVYANGIEPYALGTVCIAQTLIPRKIDTFMHMVNRTLFSQSLDLSSHNE